jgi:5-(carboxyamino)imidazole ribonucleotide mutase
MAALVGIVMGSDSDLPTMQGSAEMCERFRVEYEMRIISAHRTPDDMAEYGRTAHARGLRVIIAGAGGAAHLPGMLAAFLRGLDALLSIAQMPQGVPVAAVAIGNSRNAGLLAVRILAASDPNLQQQMIAYQAEMAIASRKKNIALRDQQIGG